MRSILFSFTALGCFQAALSQAPGTFDNTFGTTGIVVSNLYTTPGSPSGSSDDEARAVAIQPDGKIVVAGVSDDWTAANYDFVVCRYNANGTLDNTFSGDGKERTTVSNNIEFVSSVAIQSDGKIVVLGYSNSQFVLVRYNSNGTIDSSFGTAGIVFTQVSATAEQGNVLKIQPDGKILAGGYGNFNGASDCAVVRYNANGSLDNTFGTNGIVVTPIGNGSESINDIVLQPDGKILAAGLTSNTGSPTRFLVIRYNANGTLDNTFGTAGTATVAPTASLNIATSICLQADGKIVLGGRSMNPSTFDFSLARFDANGILDNTFGTAGTFVHSIGAADDINALLIQPSGKIIAAGYAMINGNRNFTLARYTTTGALDNTFGLNGIVTNSIGPSMAGIIDAAFQADGKLVGVGTTVNTANDIDFTVVRYYMDCAGPSVPGPIAGSATVCPGTKVYSVVPVAGASSYNWSLPTGWTGSSSTNTIAVNVTVSGTLQVAAVNSCTASSTASLAVKVNTCTGISEVNQMYENVLVFPNPANGIIFIDTKKDARFSYQVNNSLGMQLRKGEFSEKTELDLKNLPKGHYIVTLTEMITGSAFQKHIILTD